MTKETQALEKNQTWELVQLPEGNKPVGCIKHKPNGFIDRYKARLVAQGFTQTYGIDYQETFAQMAKINTIQVLLSLAKNFNSPLHQYDVKNAFLQGDLHEEVYTSLPPGHNAHNDASVSNVVHTLLLKRKNGKLIALIIYVDDMIVTGDDLDEIGKLKGYLASEFNMKDLGGLKYFLGIEVTHSEQGIFLSQRKYVLDLLKETDMLGCELIVTPIKQNHGLEECPHQVPTDKEQYQRLVDSLIYLSHPRSDIAYAVVSLSSAEAEYRAMVKGVCELIWLKRLMGELGFPTKDTLKLYCDNQSTIKIAENPIRHDRTKHVEIHQNFIYEKLEEKIIEVPYVKTTEQLENMFTKAVSNQAFTDSLVKLSISNIYAPS
ncbi:hypothetical protein L3X38_027274 [Prunus dulcis]|uniref:Reverse transcriptase Ty1/copia-type domain-containing protein n=1 Tax=Prunus dulcis TaxID=3755 RepID=A0AAD4Z104_PRUDU|nr:hypothetical protein L3X38_027274 [Prunus dulcis]